MSLGYSRKEIRTSLASALRNIESVASRVISGEEEPNLGLPNITYNLASENLDKASSYMRSVEDVGYREVSIEIEGRALLSDGSEAPVDDLTLEIEREIASATTLNQWVEELRLISTDYDMDEEDKPIGVATLTYAGFYQAAQPIQILSVVFVPGESTICLTATTNYAGKMTPDAFNVTHNYATANTASTSTHTYQITGLSPDRGYLMVYKFEADAIGMDVTADWVLLTDNGTANVIMTLPLGSGDPDPPPPES